MHVNGIKTLHPWESKGLVLTKGRDKVLMGVTQSNRSDRRDAAHVNYNDKPIFIKIRYESARVIHNLDG